MSKEVFVEFDGDEPIKIIDYDKVNDKSVLCTIYTHDEDVHMLRVGNNNYHTARFAGKLIGELGFRIPHPEFYPDEYDKFEKDWAKFTEFAKDHQKIIELLRRGFGCIYDILESNQPVDVGPLNGVADDLKKLGVLE